MTALIFFLLPLALLSQTPTVQVTNFTPSSATAGSPAIRFIVTGTNFTQDARIVWRFGQFGATTLPTTFFPPDRLETTIPAAFLEEAGNIPVAVVRPFETTTISSTPLTFVIFGGLGISTPCPLPNAFVGRPYTATLSPSGGTPPYAWSLGGGALPPGLTVQPSGSITGVPSAPADSTFALTVQDATGVRFTKQCSMRAVNANPNQSLFIERLRPTGVLRGAGDTEVLIDGSGFLTGVEVLFNAALPNPTFIRTEVASPILIRAVIPASLLAAPGIYGIAVRKTVLTALELSNIENFTVADPLRVATPCPIPDAIVSTAYTAQFTAAGGFPPYTWTGTGTLPDGMQLSRTGQLSGVPREAGSFRFRAVVNDSGGNQTGEDCTLRVLGPLTAFPTEATFRAVQGGLPPGVQAVSLTAGTGGVNISAQAATFGGGNWLRAELTSRTVPAQARIAVDPAGLPPGVYRGQVTVQGEGVSGGSTPIAVALTVTAPGRLTASPGVVQIAMPRSSAQPAYRTVVVTGGAPPYGVTVRSVTGGDWLVATPSGNLIRLAATAGGREAGVYRAELQVTSAQFSAPLLVPVNLSIALSPELLVAPQSGLTFQAVSEGPPPASQPVFAASAGGPGFFWEAAASALGGLTWLGVQDTANSTLSGRSSSTRATVDARGLAPGDYFGEIRLSTAAADNSPRLITTALRVLPPAANPGLELSTRGLHFTPTSRTGTVSVRNPSRTAARLEVTLSGDPSYRLTGPAPDQIGSGQSIDLTVEAQDAPLAGVRRGVLQIQASGDPRVQTVDLAAFNSIGGCVPSRLEITPQSPAPAFSQPAGFPVDVRVLIRDDCGQGLNAGSVMAFADTDPAAAFPLYSLGDDRWAATWNVLQTTPGSISLRILASNPAGSLSGSAGVGGSVTANPGHPVLSQEAIVSAASLALGGPVAPGSLISAFGAAFGGVNETPRGFPIPTQLGAARLLIGSSEVPLLFTGASQINAIVPWETLPNTHAQVSIRNGNRLSTRVDLPVAATAPAVFTTALSGSGQGIIVHGDRPDQLALPGDPTAAGRVIVIYAEGLGLTNPRGVTGEATRSDTLSPTLAPVTVTIGGRPARVLFAGLVPFFSGLFQINVEVPEGVAPGAATPVVVTAGGSPSNSVTIAVQ